MTVKDLVEGFTAIEHAQSAYKKADRYATEELPERFSSKRIADKLRGSGDEYRFRLSRKPITALTNRVKISAVTSDKSGVDALIEKIRDANDMEVQEPFLIERLATYGDVYVFVVPVEAEDEADRALTPAEQALRAAGVELRYQSPYNCRAMYDGEDGRRLRYVIRRWQDELPDGKGKRWHAELWYLGFMEEYVCEPGADGTNAEQWRRYAEDDETGQEVPVTDDNWPFTYEESQIPIRHIRTGLPYGRPQHADAYGPQDAITKAIVTQVEVDLEAHGYPERARLIDEEAAKDSARDTVAWDDNKGARADLIKTTGPGGPGTERIYRATKDVIQFPVPDPGQIVKPLEFWVRLMSTITDTPIWEFDPTAATGMNGIARWRAEKPLRDREATFKLFLWAGLREVWTLALEMVNTDPGTLSITWAPPEVNVDPDWWAVASLKRDFGVPDEETLTEAGYAPAKVEEFLSPKSNERFWGERVRILKDLSEALNQLSGPVSLGIIDASKLSALVDTIMADAGDPDIGGDGQDRTPDPAPAPLPDGRDPREVMNADTRP